MRKNDVFGSISDKDDIVYSAFTEECLNQYAWKMESTDNDEYNAIDQFVTAITKNGEVTYNVELKCRMFQALNDKYIKDCFLEVEKFKKIKKGKNKHSIYIAFYPFVKSGGVVYIWNLDKLTDEELNGWKTKRLMNEKTCSSDKKVWKEVYVLPTCRAKMYKFESKQFYKN